MRVIRFLLLGSLMFMAGNVIGRACALNRSRPQREWGEEGQEEGDDPGESAHWV